jgi:hypothetical protein
MDIMKSNQGQRQCGWSPNRVVTGQTDIELVSSTADHGAVYSPTALISTSAVAVVLTSGSITSQRGENRLH